MIIHDIIKIELSRKGYLPDYPPHLISAVEMCDAFLPYEYNESDPLAGYDACMSATLNYFRDTYPLIDDSLEDKYKTLVSEIAYHLNLLKTSKNDNYVLPDWIYSYMLGVTLTVSSDQKDLHDLFVMLLTDNLFDEYNLECANACYAESAQWLSKLPESARIHRPPTMFGEPHVLKSLRLKYTDYTE